ncbi:hypothetical protein [Arenicella xantha]|uniref:Uncharacterized protein n=1 Tax=Arenicella xantha TaxID=644221 RepID=A0A395JED6_9GAMM|nr:hypothetical protein [Arenicella xantha]RBP47024.1 hypothetical protein DFR28_1128 [Arenicella xantha]
MRQEPESVAIVKDTRLWVGLSIVSSVLLALLFLTYILSGEFKVILFAPLFLFPYMSYRYAHSEPTEYAKADLDGFEYFSRDKEFVKIPWPKIQNISYSKFEAPSVKVELNYFETRPPYYGEISGYRNKQTNLFIQIDSKAKKVVDKIISLREKATTNEN